jgi:hypothetical protein
MKAVLVALLVCFSGIAAAQSPHQIVPASVLAAKTIVPVIYYPDGNPADVNEVRWEADRFLTKWHRFDVSYDLPSADIVAYIAVEPITAYPGFWQRIAWGMAASQAGEHCSAQSYGTTATADCHTTPAPPALTPGVVLRGSILLFDGGEFREWVKSVSYDHYTGTGQTVPFMTALRDTEVPLPKPIMSALADGHGSRPLIGAGKKLRKMIDEASKSAKTSKP